ncbi:4-hydroxy-tetrahydrodipicolinate reductase [Lewinella sp. 4G2]|uniref:4-hydroxy-tetrahydrodipicolinate reductase n=1 Tax=Lewinella sp. 4G2 TaxID=1803372 RepID=UPI0007B4CE52|nr:4-hydroxy-tetrahydrodipicolinate reductase [Lewinella sp. 4G2]OAV45011.1 4-hydroxy-tetrahydrodipicolinate reductase [Lewinella sp. 4G2]
MKIALLGYGKMGRVIEGLAQAAGDEIVLRVDESNRGDITAADLAKADVAIEFSRPEAAPGNIDLALAAGVPIVVGTTGWLAQLPAISEKVVAAEGALFWASNFSVGVNVFFAAAKQLGQLLGQYPGYAASVEEIHHLQKLDSPSGTAITLAESFAAGNPAYGSWSLDRVTSIVPQQNIAPAAAPANGEKAVPIHSIREEGVPGTHLLTLSSGVDTIELKHTAHSREGFAKGALVAANFLRDKKGVFTMEDLLKH